LTGYVGRGLLPGDVGLEFLPGYVGPGLLPGDVGLRGLEFLPGGGGPGLLPGGVGTGLLPGDVVGTIQMRRRCALLTGSVQTGGRRGWPWHLKSADLRSRRDDSLSRLISGIWLSIPETSVVQCSAVQ
jgi:hypothetical protein